MQELNDFFDTEDEYEVYTPPEGIQCLCAYGPFKKGRYYNCIEDSKHYFKIRLAGQIFFTERWVFE